MCQGIGCGKRFCWCCIFGPVRPNLRQINVLKTLAENDIEEGKQHTPISIRKSACRSSSAHCHWLAAYQTIISGTKINSTVMRTFSQKALMRVSITFGWCAVQVLRKIVSKKLHNKPAVRLPSGSDTHPTRVVFISWARMPGQFQIREIW